MRRLWLIFAQTVTVCVAVLFVLKTLRPDWMPHLSKTGRESDESEVATVYEAPASSQSERPASYADAAQRALPAVVHIFTSQEVKTPRHPFLNDPVFRHFFGDRFGEDTQRRSGLGSGVIVSPEGYILTNYHVIADADEIEVASNEGRKYKARVVGADPESDLAVVKIQANQNLPVISFGSSDKLRVGDVVLAVGNPFGVGQTVTSGIVSALGRNHLGINTFENFIQTDAAINPGNSGGALVNTDGHLVGINTAIYSQSGGSMGIGFAIPISLAKSILEQIVKTGSVTRGWVGIEVQEITPELADSFKLGATQGALIAGVVRGGPADQAGIKPGDVLLKVGSKAVKDSQTMLSLIAALQPGSSESFRLKRNGRDFTLDIVIGKRPPPQRAQRR